MGRPEFLRKSITRLEGRLNLMPVSYPRGPRKLGTEQDAWERRQLMRDQAIAADRARQPTSVPQSTQFPVQGPMGPQASNGQPSQQQSATDVLQALAALFSDESTDPSADRQWLSDAERSELESLEAQRQQLVQPEPRQGFWRALGEGALGQFAHGNPWAMESQREGRRQKALDVVEKRRGDLEARREAIQKRHDQRIMNQLNKARTLEAGAEAYGSVVAGTPAAAQFSLTDFEAVGPDGTAMVVQEDTLGNMRLANGDPIPQGWLVRKPLSEEGKEREEIFGGWYVAVGAEQGETWPLSNENKLEARNWRASTEYRPQTNLAVLLNLIETDPELFATYMGRAELTPYQTAQVIGGMAVRAKDFIGDLDEDGWNRQVEIMQTILPDLQFPTWNQINAPDSPVTEELNESNATFKDGELTTSEDYDIEDLWRSIFQWLPQFARPRRPEAPNGNGTSGVIAPGNIPGLPPELQGNGGPAAQSQQQAGPQFQQRQNTVTGQFEHSADYGVTWLPGQAPRLRQ
jgi:hypothetical protein